MYDVVKMKLAIESAASVAKRKVRDRFEDAFKHIYVSDKVPASFNCKDIKINKIKIENHDHINDISGVPGFYIIFTDFNAGQNNCTLFLGSLHAVYRGECRNVKRRIQSHLFNKIYKIDYEGRKKTYISKHKDDDFVKSPNSSLWGTFAPKNL